MIGNIDRNRILFTWDHAVVTAETLITLLQPGKIFFILLPASEWAVIYAKAALGAQIFINLHLTFNNRFRSQDIIYIDRGHDYLLCAIIV